MIKEKSHSRNLTIQIFYLNHTHMMDAYNENTTLYLLLEVIDKFVINYYPRTNLKTIIHKWSDLYHAYQDNKYITINEFLKNSNKKNQKDGAYKFKIAYGGYIYMKYVIEIIPDFIMIDCDYMKKLDLNNDCKNSQIISQLNPVKNNPNLFIEKNIEYILQFLMPYEIVKLWNLNKLLFRVLMRNSLKNKLFTKIKLLDANKIKIADSDIISNNCNNDITVIDTIAIKDGYYYLKADRYGLIYLTIKLTKKTNDNNINEEEEIIRTFSSEMSCVRISNGIYLFDSITSIDNDIINYNDHINNFHFTCVKYDSNVALIYFYDFNEKYFYAVNALGDVYSYDKMTQEFIRIFKINKKEPSINISGSEISKVVVKSYGFKDNICICLNRFVVFNFTLNKKIYSNKNIKVIKSICDFMIKRDILLFELKREIVMFNTNNLQIVYKHDIIDQKIIRTNNLYLNGYISFKDKINSKFYHALEMYFNNEFINVENLVKSNNVYTYIEDKKNKINEKNFTKYFVTDTQETIINYSHYNNNKLLKYSSLEPLASIGYKDYIVNEYDDILSKNSFIELYKYDIYEYFNENIIIDKRIRYTNKRGNKYDTLNYYDFYDISDKDFPSLFKRIIVKNNSVELQFNHRGKFITKTKETMINKQDKTHRYSYELYNKDFIQESTIFMDLDYSNYIFNEYFYILYNSQDYFFNDTSILIWNIHDKSNNYSHSIKQIYNNIHVNNDLNYCRVTISLIANRLFDVIDYENMIEIIEYEISDNNVVQKEIHFYLDRLRIDKIYINDKCEIIVNNGSKFYFLIKDSSNLFFSEYILSHSLDAICDEFVLVNNGIFLDNRGMAIMFENC